ncbi:MYCBP2 (predicted), partial [Pycnogonum litorale]
EYHRSIESISTTISYACSCLLTLVVAHGNTEKILSACAALLMSSQPVTQEIIKTPDILTLLQRSVHAVLLGNTCRPDWFTRGITDKSQTDSFLINTVQDEDSEDMDDVIDNGSCIASDGINLYVHNPRIGCLYKVGSGYGGTIKGLVYAQKENFHKNSRCWLGYAKGYLYFKPLAPHASEIKILSCETLKEEGRTELQDKNWGPSVMFSDGDNIGHITSSKDDSFVVQTFKPGINQMICIHELPLKLARKCLDVFGTGLFDDGTDVHSINTGTEDEVCHVAAGKDYGLIKTTGGKILFSGKSQSLGIKQSCPGPDKWLELPMPKSSKIVQYSVGHDGLHSLLVADDGIVYFTGTARRGEDGDQSKSHRQSKASKPKKMSKLDGQFVVHSACNHGTSAVVTKHGELYMFGKDTAHCDHTSGQVLGLKDVHVIQVALGKAHAVALSKKGHVYTFGINNKGQCGRDFFGFGAKEVILPVPMSTANEEECEDEELELETDVCAGVGGGGPLDVVICTPGKHRWAADQCMVCTVCGECTGYGASCVSSTRPDRNPGLPCGCGVGDSGCSECGCCRSCAKDAGDIDQSDQELAAAVAWGSGMADGIDHRNHDALNKWSIMLGKHETLLQDYYAVGQALACADMPNEKSKQFLINYVKNSRMRRSS